MRCQQVRELETRIHFGVYGNKFDLRVVAKNFKNEEQDFIVPACSLDRNFGYKCRICMDLGEGKEEMCAPCLCDGTIKYMHVTCLKEWIKEKKSIKCELCGEQYKNQWVKWAVKNEVIQ